MADHDRETLDIEEPEQLRAYLHATGRISQGERVAIRTLTGGVSNRTVLVQRLTSSGGGGGGKAWVLKQALAKLRVQVDWFSDPARIAREAMGLRWLEKLAPPGTITPLIFEDHANHLLAMRAVPEPHENWKAVLLSGRVDPDYVRQFGTLLGTIHRGGHLRRAEIEPVFDDRSFFESLRVEPYYQYTADQEPAAAPFLADLIAHTRATRLTLVHGDYSPKNILIHAGQLILLDHEVIHWGDPAFDLGFALAHFLSKARHLPAHRSAFTRAAVLFWQTYVAALGDVPWRDGLEAWAVRHALGCLLARVAGRSPLEYLSTSERAAQHSAVLSLMKAPSRSIEALSQGLVEHREK